LETEVKGQLTECCWTSNYICNIHKTRKKQNKAKQGTKQSKEQNKTKNKTK
jgi:hypothetical protein